MDKGSDLWTFHPQQTLTVDQITHVELKKLMVAPDRALSSRHTQDDSLKMKAAIAQPVMMPTDILHKSLPSFLVIIMTSQLVIADR